MRNVAFSFLMAGALVMGGCAPVPDTRPAPEQWGDWCYEQPWTTKRGCIEECDKRYPAPFNRERNQCADGVIAS